jgi:prevent-host-death family protein
MVNPSQSRWQLRAAKARFSELFRRARFEGPQYVTDGRKETVVVVSAEEFARLTAPARQPKSLADFFAQSPLVGSGLDIDRKPEYPREVKL